MAINSNVKDLAVRLAVDGTARAKAELHDFAGSGERELKKLERAGKDADGALDRLTGRINLAKTGMVALASTAVIGGVVGGLALATRRAAEFADQLDDTAGLIGIGVENLQALRFAFGQFGLEERTTDLALQRFSRRLGEAANGGGELLGTLQQYGIAVRDADGSTRPLLAVLRDLAEATQNAGSAQDQLRIAFKAFDSEGAVGVNLLKLGAEGLDEYTRRAREAGVVIDAALIQRGAAAADQLDVVSQAIDAKLNAGLLELVPLLDLGADAFLRFTRGARRFYDLTQEDQGKSSFSLAKELANLNDRIAGDIDILARNQAFGGLTDIQVREFKADLDRLEARAKEIQDLLRERERPAAAAGGDSAAAAAAAAHEHEKALAAIEARLQHQVELAGLAADERERVVAADKAEAAARKELADISDAEVAHVRALAVAAVDRKDAVEAAAATEKARIDRLIAQSDALAKANEAAAKASEKAAAGQAKTRDATLEAVRAAERLDAAIEHSADRIVDFGADALFDVLDGRSRDFWDDFAELGKRAFAQVAAEALIRGPATNFLAGALGGQGGAGGAAGGLLSGLGQSIGGNLLGQGLGLSGLGAGLGAALNLGGLFSTGSAALAGAGGGLAAGLGVAPVAGGIGNAAAASAGLFGSGSFLGLGAVGGPLALGALALGTLAASGVFSRESRRGPTAGALIQVRDGRFVLGPTGVDNGGSLGSVLPEAERAIQALNRISTLLGRTPQRVRQDVIAAGAGDTQTNAITFFERGGGLVRGASDVVRAFLERGAFGALSAETIDQLAQGLSPVAEEMAGLAEALRTDTGATERAADAYAAAAERIGDTVADLRIGSLSPLSPLDRLSAARAQFGQAVTAGAGGDLDALANAPQLASEVLRIAEAVFASGPGFAAIFDSVTARLEGLGGASAGLAERSRSQLDALGAIEDALTAPEGPNADILKAQLAALRQLGQGSSAAATALAAVLGARADLFGADVTPPPSVVTPPLLPPARRGKPNPLEGIYGGEGEGLFAGTSGFAEGGRFTVGGAGATGSDDRFAIGILARRGEEISVARPGGDMREAVAEMRGVRLALARVIELLQDGRTDQQQLRLAVLKAFRPLGADPSGGKLRG